MARDLQPCGTRGGYQRHRAYGQTPCEPCTTAHTAYNKQQANDKRLAAQRRAVLAEAVGHGSYGGIAGGS